MKGSEAKLVSYMQGADKRFIIPVYQRNYDWKTENCKQLYDDLVKVIKKNLPSHFFGSLVSVHNDGAYNEFLVIDGQQRLTTISLLFLAMYNLMKSGAIVPAQGNLAEKIYKTYLIDEWQEDDTKIKLKPVKNDRKALDCLFDEDSSGIPESNLTVNYNYFCGRIQQEELSVDDLYAAITRLEIINITLNQEDNPQLIFESLNSTGVALSEGDKIRNLILMGQPTKQQNDYYEKYWNKIEICTGYEVSLFVRDYLSVKQQAIPALNKIYITFKNYMEDLQTPVEDLLGTLLGYAKRYEILLKGKTADDQLNACIYRLNRLESTVTRPFFLEVLCMWEEGKLSLEEVRSIFLLTENYLFRRTICDLPTNALNKIFLTLHKEILRFDGTESDYFNKFKYALLSKNDRVRFPNDEEFAEAFTTRQIYPMNSKNKIYIFERIENRDTIEDKDIYRHFDAGEYSIEHIMPQHLTPTWIKSLGDDYEQIHETWLHRIANLTLTGYNSKYSNNDFSEKRTIKHGFSESGLRMNQWIANQTQWTLSELEQRSSDMEELCLKIWPIPTTTYKPAEKQMDYVSLDEDIDLSGRDIVKFAFGGTEQPVISWIDMFERVIKILYAEDKAVLIKLAYASSDENELGSFVNKNQQELRSALQIDTNLYVERNTSTPTKIVVLKRLFKEYHIEPEKLVFYLRNGEDTASHDEAGSRYELRRRYWTFALEYIHREHENGGIYHNVSRSKENWLSGFVGISGVSVSCVANYDSARVEYVFGTSSKEKNKQMFDRLSVHKQAIEEALGVQLNWRRLDDVKVSTVTYILPDVSITNESDWVRMAKFHAKWSRKFFDVITPYLKQ